MPPQTQPLHTSEERFRLLVNGVTDYAMILYDPQGRITGWNPGAGHVFGHDEAEALGQHSALIFTPEDRDAGVPEQELKTAATQGRSPDVRWHLRKDGSRFWADGVMMALRGETGGLIGFGKVLRDASDLKRAEEERAVAYRREALLNRIGRAVLSSGDPEEVQSTAVHALAEALRVDRAYYNTLDLARDRSWIGDDYRRADLPSLAGEYRLSEYQIDPAAYFPDGTTLVVPDIHVTDWSTPLTDVLRTLRVRAAIGVPLFDRGGLVGTLAVAMADEPREWTAAEIALVEAVAQQTRAALEASAAERREHRIATELQEALLPTIPRRAPGLRLGHHYRAALQEARIGGDFASVFSADPGVSYLVVGDLSGKGLAAASQIAVVTNMLRFAVLNGRTLAGPVSALNNTLADNELLSGFATMFVGRYDAAARSLTYVNCGQDAGLVRRAAGGEIMTLPTTGPVLGAISGAPFTEETAVLEVGDVLALYTDGLTEAGPTRTALLTNEGVAAILAGLTDVEEAQGVVSGLITGVDAYATGIVSDDQCLLVAVVDD